MPNDAAVLIGPIESAVRMLPLYDPAPPDGDGWHAVRSPGGYEWWHFDAEDDSGQIRLVAGLCEGFVFHPGYLRRYYRYLADPTHHVPPLPGEYPCAWFAVFEAGRALAEYLTQVRPEEFAASAAGPEVRVGSNQLNRNPDGSLRLRLTGESLSGELTFQSKINSSSQTVGNGVASAAFERDFVSRKMTGADHRWIIANPLCQVRGEIHLRGRAIGFAGRGYHDHNFGSGPLGPGLRRWIRGRVLWDDAMFAFHYARPRRGRLGDEVGLVQGDASGVRDVPVMLAGTDWSGRTALAVRYPTRLQLKTMDAAAVEIRLEAPRVIQATPYQLRLTYEARFGPRMGQAFCEVGYPRRLTWPLVGRMIENSIEKPR